MAAVLYIDDSDLFHMTQGTPTDDEFLDLVQRATDDWAGLVHATGGSLKPQKCFWYMLGWLWKKGRARLKTLAELPQTPLQIPQPDGTRVPIVLNKVDCPEKKTWYIYMSNRGLLLPCESAGRDRFGVCRTAQRTAPTSSRRMDGYTLPALSKVDLRSSSGDTCSPSVRGRISVNLVQASPIA